MKKRNENKENWNRTTVSISIAPDMLDFISRQAEISGMNRSAFVVMILNRYKEVSENGEKRF